MGQMKSGAIVRCTVLLPWREPNSWGSNCTHRECYFKRKIQAVGQVFTSQDSSDAVSLSQVPAFVRGGGPSAFVKSRHRKELDEDASHALHTKAGGEKIFRRRTGNDETNFAGSV